MKYLCLFSIIIIFSCKNKTDNTYEKTKVSKNTKAISTESQAQNAKALMTNLCYTCHNPETSHEELIAPPMIAIKMNYLRDVNTEKEFADALWSFVEKPSQDKVKMKGAEKRFGLMPYQAYDKDDIKAIASYMYQYELEKPEWFDDHLREQNKKPFNPKGKRLKKQKQKGPKQKGMDMVLATKKELGKNLMKALKKEGPVHAVEFCNVQAMPITNKKQEEFNAKIKRASDKPRNSKNKATRTEEVHINTFKSQLANGEKIEPIVEKNRDHFDFYYPIVTNDMCLKCHGEVGKDIQDETYKTITLKYPEDLAVGYNANEVRGIWHIEFQKNQR